VSQFYPSSSNLKVSFDELRQRARSALHRGDIAESERFLAKVLKQNKKDHGSYAIIAELHLSQNRIHEALLSYMRAVNLHPQSLAYKERFLEIAGRTLATGYSKPLADALVACLKTRELDCTKVTRFWLSLVKVAPRFEATFGLATRKSFDPSNRLFFEQLTDFRPLFTPLFLEGIKNLLVYDPLFEEFITHIRRHLLNDLGSERSKFTPGDHLTLAAALSHYAFFSDFLLSLTAEEESKIEALTNRIESETSAAKDASSIAVLACYRPLYGLANATEILENFTKPHP
jgi:tetratricopeptide (TPR) repeat protein